MASDPEAHGQQIFAELTAGKYGPIGPYVVSGLPPDGQFAAVISAGLAITCTSAPAVTGTYGVSNRDLSAIMAEAQFIGLFGEFTCGGPVSPWPDIDGQLHVFPDTATFLRFAKAVAQYVSACRQTRDALRAGRPATFPADTASL
ncbi:hypothetical protein G3A43_40590 [Paraburkholderia aspalathi]|uniref:hypothetical protein n=1 Tax=Paraburkholderia nemoris TaxID=2793076 RepID=UPI00190E412C|nr:MULTISPECIES: hypothetical protein [Paraburkholderia]MBK3786501.1 hypothetical protein [Paraburkholderia aspalathi]